MRTIHAPKSREQRRYRRKVRVRQRVAGTAERPRLTVFRSNKHMYVQIVDDEAGTTLASTSTKAK
ncbi:MAG: 50S ribosomal protein L18, partial [Gemmatimonadetes bacterium HGW-Gemmatimonadetes-1]